jgi:integrase/recombinase XerD
MALGKQAKLLSKGQIQSLLGYVSKGRYGDRNSVIALLSLRAGLRAKEIAGLTWSMVTDCDGNITKEIRLENRASKGRSGRIIPLNSELRNALVELKKSQNLKKLNSEFVVITQRSKYTSPQVVVNQFSRWYKELGFSGASSHSGRRTAITGWARRISNVGGSLRDVQLLAGHSNLATTQRYIEADTDAMKRVVELV